MRWLWRGARLDAVLLWAVLGGVAGGLLRGHQQPVPSLTGAGLVPVPLAALAGLLPVVGMLRSWFSLPLAVVETAVRPVAASRVAALVVGAAVAATTAAVLFDPGTATEVGRDTLGLAGAAAIGRTLLGAGGGLSLPLAGLVLAFLFGSPRPGSSYWWAWVLRPELDPVAMGSSLLLTVVGIGALLRRGRPLAGSSL